MFYSTRDTGPWPAPEVRQNMNITELGNLRLSQQDVDDLVTFMKTLTDGYRPE
jgi:cytochrome c peroxidase